GGRANVEMLSAARRDLVIRKMGCIYVFQAKGAPHEPAWFIPLRHYWSVYDTFNGSIVSTYVSEPAGLAQTTPGTMLVGYEPRNFYLLDQIRRPGEIGLSRFCMRRLK